MRLSFSFFNRSRKKGRTMENKYECAKCHKEIPGTSDRFVYVRGHEEIAKIRLCPDCAEKALVVLADALELPDWD